MGKLIEFLKFYQRDFCPTHLAMFNNQLETYIIHMHNNVDFASLKGINNFSNKLVESGRHIVYILVYLFLYYQMYFLTFWVNALLVSIEKKEIFNYENCEK
ncbi:hypothetical protein Lal_00035282 [Lupinus albus]|nr:hypothetical protein Lal_00035282 [Lupinus albus]